MRIALRPNRGWVGVLCIGLLVAIVVILVAAGSERGNPSAPAMATVTRTIAPCSWSFFGDPRAVEHGDWVFTGCISTSGEVLLDEFDLRTRQRLVLTLFRGLEIDDHNNPSLIFFHNKLYAFVSPHSGYVFPRDRNSVMRYRVSKGDFGAGTSWGPQQSVPLKAGCGLGYTYPNPVVSGRRLYLFMRGPCWQPLVTTSTDGEHWTVAQTLVSGPASAGRSSRPYAKYASAPDGSILMTFSEGHPDASKNSLYYMRFTAGRYLRADGSQIGDTSDLPFRFSQLDLVQKFSRRLGRPWPMDLAWNADGTPSIVYSSRVGGEDDPRRVGGHDDFRYARWHGASWRTRLISSAGGRLFGYSNGGITFDHADPRWIALSSLIDGEHEIELRYTGDDGITWNRYRLTKDSNAPNFRPVFPRDMTNRNRFVVISVSGTAPSFRTFDTFLTMRTLKPPAVTVHSTPK